MSNCIILNNSACKGLIHDTFCSLDIQIDFIVVATAICSSKRPYEWRSSTSVSES